MNVTVSHDTTFIEVGAKVELVVVVMCSERRKRVHHTMDGLAPT